MIRYTNRFYYFLQYRRHAPRDTTYSYCTVNRVYRIDQSRTAVERVMPAYNRYAWYTLQRVDYVSKNKCRKRYATYIIHNTLYLVIRYIILIHLKIVFYIFTCIHVVSGNGIRGKREQRGCAFQTRIRLIVQWDF
jgi:hypothetical protein